MHKLNVKTVIFCLLVCTTMCLKAERFVVLTKPEIPEDYPLRLVNLQETHVGNIMDWETRKITIKIKNITDKALKLLSIRPGCTCITFPQKLRNITMQPHQEYTIALNLIGYKIYLGDFTKIFYLEPENHPVAKVGIKGTAIQKLFFSPAQCINLGRPLNMLNWKRSFVITSKIDDPNFKILPPQEDKDFLFQFKQLNAHQYQLDVSPRKLPLRRGTHNCYIVFKTKGIPNYDSFYLLVSLYAESMKLTLEQNSHVITPETINKQAPYSVTSRIVLENMPTNEPNMFHSKSPRFAVQPVMLDELKDDNPYLKQETWETEAKRIKVSPFGSMPGVTFKIVPTATHIDIITTFPTNFFQEGKHAQRFCRIKYGNQYLRKTLVFRW